MQNFGFVFPGQGSQKLGMLKEHADRSPIIKSTFAEGELSFTSKKSIIT